MCLIYLATGAYCASYAWLQGPIVPDIPLSNMSSMHAVIGLFDSDIHA